MSSHQCSCGAVYRATDPGLRIAGYADEDGMATPRELAVFALVNCGTQAHARPQTIAIPLRGEDA